MSRVALALLAVVLGCSPTSSSGGESNKVNPKDEAGAKASANSKAKPVRTDAAKREVDPKLLDPAAAAAEAPPQFKVKFATTKGDFVVEVNRAWAPLGADRFYSLVKVGFFDDAAFFRAIKGFMVQFGINGSPEVTDAWRTASIKDDPVKESNGRGFMTFAKKNSPNSRTTQVFINFGDNTTLDGMGFAPFGKVVEGMDVVDSLHTGYGEGAPSGMGPGQAFIERRGNEYLRREFPKLDYVKTATIIE